VASYPDPASEVASASEAVSVSETGTASASGGYVASRFVPDAERE
jgi:hypothetical protein